ncbi:MAG: hypothetical protein BMS9Abin36_1775 [Gammaproteobacteria bacterium]|nr:MAG: hypothetical protein BMS9Abin36_1775 [Gammaproteobacteria bacterium]
MPGQNPLDWKQIIEWGYGKVSAHQRINIQIILTIFVNEIDENPPNYSIKKKDLRDSLGSENQALKHF